MKGDRMGEDYGIVRKIHGQFEVEIFGVNVHDRVQKAMEAFENQVFSKYAKQAKGKNTMMSLGLDKHDPLVERFRLVDVK